VESVQKQRGRKVNAEVRGSRGRLSRAKSVVTSPALPFAWAEVVLLDQIVISAVMASNEVLPTAWVACALPRDRVIATGIVVPQGGPPRRRTSIPWRPEWFQGELLAWFLRGLCRANEVVPR
jgi:hypothetical protein